MSVIITGSDGLLGGRIIRRMMEQTDYDVVGLTLDMNRVESMLSRESLNDSRRLRFMMNDDFLREDSSNLCIDGAVHLAFSRRMQPAEEIASSIPFAASIFHKLIECSADRVINMSSQGVYGNTSELRTEKTPPAPGTQYTMAKYAAEVLFNDIMVSCPHHTNFRLDPVVQSQNIIKGLCNSAIEGKIVLKGGKQVFSFIDVDDVPSAVIALLNADGDWAPVYNVGWSNKRYLLTELADMVASIAEKSGYKRPVIELEQNDLELWAGMDSTLFMEKTGWKPSIDLQESLEKIMKR